MSALGPFYSSTIAELVTVKSSTFWTSRERKPWSLATFHIAGIPTRRLSWYIAFSRTRCTSLVTGHILPPDTSTALMHGHPSAIPKYKEKPPLVSATAMASLEGPREDPSSLTHVESYKPRTLDADVFLNILQFLEASDLVRAMQTCHLMYELGIPILAATAGLRLDPTRTSEYSPRGRSEISGFFCGLGRGVNLRTRNGLPKSGDFLRTT
ncbi:hypothetical protein K474DRAFT_990671 [Panus rudis PR-1116 ss-1]|nr:hypothetical protein K474DRAFT_990671 [Panus rudis PR-1116 ss-1]